MLPVFHLVLCIKSEQGKKKKKSPKLLKCLCVSSPSPRKADSHHVPKRRLAWIARGAKWHFQHKQMIMCADLSVRPLLAQPVGQGAGTRAPVPVWPQLRLSAGTSGANGALHTSTQFVISIGLQTLTVQLLGVMVRWAVALPLPTLCLLSDVKAPPGERRTPWTRLWTQPGITSDTRTLITYTGI